MSNKKRALLVAYNDLNNSGVPNVIYQTIKTIYKEYDVDIIIFSDDLFYYEKLKKEGIKNVNLIRLYSNKPKSKFKLLFYHFFVNPRIQYRKTFLLDKKAKYDVLHSFKERDSWPFFKAAKKAKIPLRIYHSNISAVKQNSPIIKLLDKKNKRLSLKYSNCYIGVSKNSCENSFHGKDYHIIHNGYDASFFNNKVGNKLKNNELVLTQVATFNENKNQLFSIAVLRELIQLYPNAKLQLIGKAKDSLYLNLLKKNISDYNLSDNVKVLDGTNGTGDALMYTTFTILPSHSEGASITAIESQACGISVFASTNVPKEIDVGGVIFLDLEDGPKTWANKIYQQFEKEGNARKEYNLSDFSNKLFQKQIKKIYGI